MDRIKTYARLLAGLTLLALLFWGYATTVWDEVNLMPAPDRRPASEGDNEKYYVNDRGHDIPETQCDAHMQ